MLEHQIGIYKTIEQALVKIEINKDGIIFVVDSKAKVCGSLTDGDIRRHLLNGGSIGDPVNLAMNSHFKSVEKGSPRHLILNSLDQNIKVIAEVDDSGRLLKVHTRDRLKFFPKKVTSVQSRAPVRLTFCGGGSDTKAFFSKAPGAVLNATINLFSNAKLKIRDDDKIWVNSADLMASKSFSSLLELEKNPEQFKLAASVVKIMKPTFGFDLHLWSDFPLNSGMGGSSAVLTSIILCFNEAMGLSLGKHDVAQLAFQAERLCMGVSGGWQDQYCAVTGGLNLMEFDLNRVRIIPVQMSDATINSLEQNLVLCFLNGGRNSGEIHSEQEKSMADEQVFLNAKTNVDLCYQLYEDFCSEKIGNIGSILHKSWELKKSFARGVSSAEINNIYEYARTNGAIGGKLLGAGGGGFFLFYCEPEDRVHLMNSLSQKGLVIQPFRFEFTAAKAWSH